MSFKKKLVLAVVVMLGIAVALSGCAQEEPAVQSQELQGDLVVYHAGSLAIPFELIEKEFEAIYPKVDVKRTSGGSVDIARKVTELGDKVDILASADYKVVDTLLIPDFAQWNALFAKNSMVIMYTDKSIYADEINETNWYNILLRDGVNFGHSVPDSDPCGYRSVLLWQLAEEYYQDEGLAEKLAAACPEKNIRPKSVELISLLETGGLDYAFEYESVARQHALNNPIFKYVMLPDEINLSSVEHKDFYLNSSIDLKGKNPGEVITTKGEPIVYSVTMPTTGEHQELAVEFLKFFFNKDQGLKIFEDNGQPVLDKIQVTGNDFPEELNDAIK